MSIKFNDSNNGIVRTTGLFNYNNPYTFMGWFFVYSDPGATSTLFALQGIPQGSPPYEFVGINPGPTYYVDITGGSPSSAPITPTWSNTGQWVHVAAVRESTTSYKIYENGTQIGTTVTIDVSGRSSNRGADTVGWYATSGDHPLNGAVAYMKAWTAGLTQAEVAAEMSSIAAVRTADLFAVWDTPSGANRLEDISGNGHDWSAHGTLADDTNPPMTQNATVNVTGVEADGAVGTVTVTAVKNRRITETIYDKTDALIISSAVTYAVFDGSTFDMLHTENHTTDGSGIFEILYPSTASVGDSVFLAVFYPALSSQTQSAIWSVTLK